MFENYRAWRKRNLEKTERIAEHDWKTIEHLIVNDGRKWFAGYVYGAMWWFASIAFFAGVIAGSSVYVPDYTLSKFIGTWWIWIVAAVVIGLPVEFRTHSTRDFYRRRRSLFGSWFK